MDTLQQTAAEPSTLSSTAPSTIPELAATASAAATEAPAASNASAADSAQPKDAPTTSVELPSASQGLSLITPAPVAVTGSATHETVGLPSGSSPLPDTTFTWGGYFQAIGILIILLCVLWYVLRLVRRFAGGTLMAAGTLSRQDLRMEAQLPVGPRKGVVVVRFLNKRLLLGVTDQQISLLTEIDVDLESPNGPTGPNGADGTDEKEMASKFQRLLEQAVPGKTAAGRRLFGASSPPSSGTRRS